MIIIRYILYSLEDIISKLALINSFISPQTLIFYKGLFSSIYLLVLTASLFCFDGLKSPDINSNFFANIFCRLYFVLFNIIRNLYIVKVIDVFSSQHISLLRVLETIFLFIYYKIDSKYKKQLIDNNKDTNIFDNYFHLDPLYEWMEVGAFFILLFGTLVHNEIIILNCKRYNKNTIYYLNIEASREKLDLHLNANSTIDEANDITLDYTQTISTIPENSSLENSISF